ncbi:MAG: ribonuclease P protein component [Cyanobacteria bacterium P01_F01_bin.53]
MALPRKNRLGSSRDFSRVHRRGNRAATKHLAIRALRVKNKGLRVTSIDSSNATQASKKKVVEGRSVSQPIRRLAQQSPRVLRKGTDEASSVPFSSFGISISRKVSKRAVVRNRIKRQLKAIIRQNLADISPGWQVVIVVRPSALECGFDDFLRELERLLKKLNILNVS